MQHHGRPGLPRRRQGPRSQQGEHVVGVCHGGAKVAYSSSGVALALPSPHERHGSAGAAAVRRAALEQSVLHARALHCSHLKRQRSLLAALHAVAVVQEEDPGRSHGAAPRATGLRPRSTGLTYRSP